ncbi:LacI family transcriptional regulator [Virgisporangium ochraceum]|uniref:LacI family transcriptional regulator n=1 Tax=Virgisporangium ochraceum TaxID=65505 RepID=A0A8J4EJ76_9ACTN|nr:LacI family transcriptional regulator [Virgisporangium ochraceum]
MERRRCYRGAVSDGRRVRGEIEKLPSGSLRVRVYAGIDPVTRRRRYLTRTVPAGPTAVRDAEHLRSQLLADAAVRPARPAGAACLEVVFFGMQSNLAIPVLHGVEAVAAPHDLTVGFVDVLHRSGRSWAHDLLARRPTGVVTVCLSPPTLEHEVLAAGGVPLVTLDPTGEPDHPVPSVGAADAAGATAAARHLLGLGHRRIGVITGPPDRLCARARLDGARAAMDAAGVPLDPALVRTGLWFAFEDGLNHARELLRLPDPPTALLCGNDLQALGACEAARRAGLRIPQDLSVVGFDDIPPASWCGPALTTVRQPFTEMGAAAAGMVVSMAAGRPPERTRVELPTTLIVRDSTAPPSP